jgi:hypothetical protein
MNKVMKAMSAKAILIILAFVKLSIAAVGAREVLTMGPKLLLEPHSLLLMLLGSLATAVCFLVNHKTKRLSLHSLLSNAEREKANSQNALTWLLGWLSQQRRTSC